jgi:ABC-type nitrate/sulfonate/bicarbonate transport system ATPase subunit
MSVVQIKEVTKQFGPTTALQSIAEALFLTTRVVVKSPRPGRIADVIPIDLPRPRSAGTREDPHFFELVTQVREALHLGHDTDRKAAAPA